MFPITLNPWYVFSIAYVFGARKETLIIVNIITNFMIFFSYFSPFLF